MNIIASSSILRLVSASSSPSLRTDLKEIRDCWFHLLIFCTVMVALGVLLEQAEESPFPSSKSRLDITKGVPIPSPWTKWKKEIAHFGWVLILWGVIGECLFEAAISNADGMLQDFSDTLLVITEEQAGKASASATHARLEVRLTDQYAKRIASELARQIKREEEAENQLEIEKEKRLAVASGLLPRIVCDQLSLARAISYFPRRKVIFEFPSEREPRRFAEQMAWSFGGWQVSRRRVDEDAIADGVYIITSGESVSHDFPLLMPFEQWPKAQKELSSRLSTADKLALTVRDELRACNVEAVEGADALFGVDLSNDGIPADALVIRIGSKPNPALETTIRELGPPSPTSNSGSSFAFSNLAHIPEERPKQ